MKDIQERFRLAMRGTVSGVSIVTAAGETGHVGVTVSSLSSLSLEPPSILVAIHEKSYALATIEARKHFAANILSGSQMYLAEIFAGRRPDMRGDRFSHACWRTLASGAPILEHAIAAFDCKLVQVVPFGSHRILLGEVLDLRHSIAPALFYSNGVFGTAQSDLG